MKTKRFFSIIAMSCFAMASTFTLTACGDDKDDNPTREETKVTNRTVFQQHVKGNLKMLASNMNFGSLSAASTVNQNFNKNVLANPAFKQTLHAILQQQIQTGAKPATIEAVKAAGFQYQSIVDLSQLHYRFTLKEDKSGFDMAPAEHFELVHTADGATNKLSIDMSGDSKMMLSRILSKPEKSLAVIMLIPAKIEFAISTTALTGTETEIFKGELNNDIQTAGELMNILQDDWNIKGSLTSKIPATASAKADQMELTINLDKDPTTKKFVNQFAFTHNGMKMVEIDAINTHQGNLMALLLQMLTSAAQGQESTSDDSLLSLLLSTVVGNSVDQLKLTIANDLTADIRISDVGKAAAVLAQSKAAHRNYASKETVDGFTQQLNQLVSGSLECKGVNQQIPMTLQTTAFGADYVSMPAFKFADEDAYVPFSELVDMEGMTYAINIIDHTMAPARQSIITVRQLLTILPTLLAVDEVSAQ